MSTGDFQMSDDQVWAFRVKLQALEESLDDPYGKHNPRVTVEHMGDPVLTEAIAGFLQDSGKTGEDLKTWVHDVKQWLKQLSDHFASIEETLVQKSPSPRGPQM